MRRMIVGFVVLFAIAFCGICFVEYGARVRKAGAASDDTDSRSFRLVIGGAPSAGDPAASDAAGGKSQNDAGTEAASEQQPWREPDPVLRHKVAKGDTPTKIALEYLGTGSKEAVDRILQANKLKSPKELKIDSVLKIPVARFEKPISDGKKSVRDFAKRYYGSEDRCQPLRHANPNLPKDSSAKVPMGFTVFVPR